MIDTQLREVDVPALRANDIARVEIAFAEPIAADTYVQHRATGAFALIATSEHATLAAGMVHS